MNRQTDKGASAAKHDLGAHPCFNSEARHTHARIHLPVAGRCNMQCNYCNRKYSCVNESRPGVTGTLLTPGQAIAYLRNAAAKLPNLSVVGIAGPGDPFANAAETLETLRMVKAEFPHLLLCVATNGLNLPAYVDDLVSIGISHVTVTVNAAEASIAAKFYEWIALNGKRVSGVEACTELWQAQAEAIRALSSKGVTVKVNTIYTPGINDGHIDTVAKTVSVLGAAILNVMPLLPTANTAFAALLEPDREALQNARHRAMRFLPQMTHCSRCRADAAGLIGQPNSAETAEMLMNAKIAGSQLPVIGSEFTPVFRKDEAVRIATSDNRPYIAVASQDSLFVNQHLGAAQQFRIYRPGQRRSVLVDIRSVDAEASGMVRWMRIAEKLNDCAAILVSGAGALPRKLLAHYNVPVWIVGGLIDEALSTIASGGDLSPMLKHGFSCSTSCSGERSGCEE